RVALPGRGRGSGGSRARARTPWPGDLEVRPSRHRPVLRAGFAGGAARTRFDSLVIGWSDQSAHLARIVLSSCIFRYPMGGMMSWLLQYLVGYRSLGHEVTYVEKAAQADDCFDPTRDAMSDGCGYGVRAVAALLERFGFGQRWHFLDVAGRSYG